MHKNYSEISEKSPETPFCSPAIYLVLSQSGTWLSRALKWITKSDYNHVSISLDKNLRNMYSFSRRNPYNPVWGGFMMESPFFGPMKRFRQTTALIMRVPVSECQHRCLSEMLRNMYLEKEKYCYNIPGLFLACVGIVYHRKNQYYCSEFVKDALSRFQIVDASRFKPITAPGDFLGLKEFEIIYIGNLREYAIRCTPELLLWECVDRETNLFRKCILKCQELLFCSKIPPHFRNF